MTPSDPATDLRAFLLAQLADPANEWSTGTFGALAEFSREPDEPFTLREHVDRLELSTAHGALRLVLHPALRPIAYETLGEQGGWQHGVALCLPRTQARTAAREAITVLGPDDEAVDPGDRTLTRVDLGFGCETADLCIRTGEAGLLQAVAAHAGLAPLDGGRALLARIAASSPHRVFATRVARIEVRQPIPPPDGTTPTGPHTHLLPALMRTGRTHAATLPIPQDWVPCASLHPPASARRVHGAPVALDADAHAAFQSMLGRWGEPGLVALKREVGEALSAGTEPACPAHAWSRSERLAARVAVRQWRAMTATDARLPRWAEALEPGTR